MVRLKDIQHVYTLEHLCVLQAQSNIQAQICLVVLFESVGQLSIPDSRYEVNV